MEQRKDKQPVSTGTMKRDLAIYSEAVNENYEEVAERLDKGEYRDTVKINGKGLLAFLTSRTNMHSGQDRFGNSIMIEREDTSPELMKAVKAAMNAKCEMTYDTLVWILRHGDEELFKQAFIRADESAVKARRDFREDGNNFLKENCYGCNLELAKINAIPRNGRGEPGNAHKIAACVNREDVYGYDALIEVIIGQIENPKLNEDQEVSELIAFLLDNGANSAKKYDNPFRNANVYQLARFVGDNAVVALQKPETLTAKQTLELYAKAMHMDYTITDSLLTIKEKQQRRGR